MFERFVNVVPVEGDLVFKDKVANRFMFVIFSDMMANDWEAESTFNVAEYFKYCGLDDEDFTDEICVWEDDNLAIYLLEA